MTLLFSCACTENYLYTNLLQNMSNFVWPILISFTLLSIHKAVTGLSEVISTKRERKEFNLNLQIFKSKELVIKN